MESQKPNFFEFLGILTLIFILASCNKNNEEDYVPNGKEKFFAIEVYVFTGWDRLGVSFISTPDSVLPTVEFNGIKITNFEVGGYSMVYIPCSEVINYSVTAYNKTTSGTIRMAPGASSMFCNDTLLDENNFRGSNILVAENYNFNWISESCDYQRVSIEGIVVEADTILNSNVTEYSSPALRNSSSSFTLYLYSINGVLLQPGATPNFSGAFGRGYVSTSNSQLYMVNTVWNKSAGINERALENRKKEFINNFNALTSGK